MSHEIRTPLNGILGMTQALAADPTAAPHADRLAVMQRSGEALLSVLNDVLDLSKIEAGKLELEVIDFDLGPLMGEVHDAFSAMAAGKGLNLTLEIEAGLGRYRGDPTRIRQILFNLVSNAIKFTTAGEVRLGAYRGSGILRLSVTDTGIGIAEEARAAIFGKFSQADSSTTRRFGGSGLGLAICRDLALLMNSDIWVESRVGQGSRFVLALPLERVGDTSVAVPAATADAAPGPGDLSSLRILAAEDNSVNQLVLRTLLTGFGVEATIVDNGALAVEAWTAGRWDLVLMDVQMPVMDGIDATRAIRARELETGAPRTPIVALTANAMAHQTATYLAAGMDAQLDKPIDATRLYAVLQAVAEDRAPAIAPLSRAS